MSFQICLECVTGGDDMAEAIFLAEDAASGWILTELEESNIVPKPTELSKIKVEQGQFVNMVALDMDTYAAKHGNKSVKKTLTIPAWLNTYVEENNISCSEILRESLSKMAHSSIR